MNRWDVRPTKDVCWRFDTWYSMNEESACGLRYTIFLFCLFWLFLRFQVSISTYEIELYFGPSDFFSLVCMLDLKDFIGKSWLCLAAVNDWSSKRGERNIYNFLSVRFLSVDVPASLSRSEGWSPSDRENSDQTTQKPPLPIAAPLGLNHHSQDEYLVDPRK